MKQALNATFFGLDPGIENDTLMTILLIAEVVVCVLLLALMIYILCEKKRAAVIRKEMIKRAKKEAAANRAKGGEDFAVTQIYSDSIRTWFVKDGKVTTAMGAKWDHHKSRRR